MIATVLVVVFLIPAPALAADELPKVTGSDCVPPSRSTVAELPWAQAWLQPARAWPLTRGDGVTVAVIDGGVGTPASLAGGAVEAGTTDCTGHGTLLASLVAGRVTKVAFAGVAPAAKILDVKLAEGSYQLDPPLATPDALATGIRSAISGGARVILLGEASTGPSPALKAAVEAAVRADALVVCGVGTVESSGSRVAVSYPSAYPGVLGVAAMQKTGAVADFSALSSDVDLTAPGVEVLGAAPSGTGHYLADGTSVAAAFVAGTAALVRAYRPDLDVADVTERLELTAAPAPAETRDAAMGYGVVDPADAVGAELPPEAGQTQAPPLAIGVTPDRPTSKDPGAKLIAVAVAALGLAVTTLAGLLAVVLRAARARRWRAP